MSQLMAVWIRCSLFKYDFDDRFLACFFGLLGTNGATKGLCTIPNPQTVLRDVYRYLKPGGELRMVEHVQSSDEATQWVQGKYTLLLGLLPVMS